MINSNVVHVTDFGFEKKTDDEYKYKYKISVIKHFQPKILVSQQSYVIYIRITNIKSIGICLKSNNKYR